jgi:3-methyl-2-oxobutanoate hydroxymethyltransferase
MRLTIRDIQKMKDQGERIAMITAYDAMSARLSEAAGAPMLLVGDSLGMVVQGHDTPIPVTLDQMIYHTQIVARVTQRALIVGDLPFMTYKVNPEQALTNAARLIQEGRANTVKMEGGEWLAPTIARVVEAGIPVMAHIGLTPQSVYELGGFHVQGKDVETARQLLADAKAIQDAGAFAVVLELLPAPLAKLITSQLRIPTIGIGAGVHCDGQVPRPAGARYVHAAPHSALRRNRHGNPRGARRFRAGCRHKRVPDEREQLHHEGGCAGGAA